MRRRPSIPWLTACLLALVTLAIYLRVRTPRILHTPAPPLAGAPTLMLWAWETPEDLTALNPTRAGVAFLSREILLGATQEVRPRRQPLHLPPGIFLIPVVRIETSPSFLWPTADLDSIASRIAQAALETHAPVLQVDFDAHVSERLYYTAILRSLRKQLPPSTALSITALVSWCGHKSWLETLPIDEAVPMFFRMGGPSSTRALAPRSFTSIEEPLCTGSLGVSTDERWPSIQPRQRVYVFRPGSWTPEDLASINAGHYQQLQNPALRSTQGQP